MKRIVFLLLVIIPTLTYSQEFEKGKEIFTTNCAGCHNMEKRVVGPALQNVIELQGRDWASKWISNNAELIKTGDAHANEVFNEYNKMAMPAFDYLKPEELNAILDYIEGYKKEKAATAPVVAAPATGEEVSATTTSNSGLSKEMWLIIIIVTAVIITALLVISVSIKMIANISLKTQSFNRQLLKKLDGDKKELTNEFDAYVESEVTKRVNVLKNDINKQIKNFK